MHPHRERFIVKGSILRGSSKLQGALFLGHFTKSPKRFCFKRISQTAEGFVLAGFQKSIGTFVLRDFMNSIGGFCFQMVLQILQGVSFSVGLSKTHPVGSIFRRALF